MRIGFFTDNYLPRADGIAFAVENYRTHLEALGHEVYIFAPRPSLRYKEPSKRIIRFPAVKGLFFDDYLASFYFPPTALRQIERLKLDIIHFHTPSQVGLLGAYFALRNNIPLVTTYHTDLFEYVKHYPSVLPGTIALSMLAPAITGGGMAEFRSGLSAIKPEKNIDKWNQKIVERGVTMIHNHCDVVISPSRKIEHQLESWHTKSRIVVIPTGVDKITTTTRDINRERATYGLEPGDKIILFVGRVGTEKNIGLLIEAFDTIGRKDPKAKAIIVGTGDDLENYRSEAAKSPYGDRIIFTGLIDRKLLGALYELADVFAFPSLTDTQGLVVHEAAQAGLPIVMVDPDVTEIVKNGQNGYFAKPTPKDFAAKLLQVIQDPKHYEAMSRRSIELAEQFNATNQAAKLYQLYEETIERHSEQTSTQNILQD